MAAWMAISPIVLLIERGKRDLESISGTGAAKNDFKPLIWCQGAMTLTPERPFQISLASRPVPTPKGETAPQPDMTTLFNDNF